MTDIESTLRSRLRHMSTAMSYEVEGVGAPPNSRSARARRRGTPRGMAVAIGAAACLLVVLSAVIAVAFADDPKQGEVTTAAEAGGRPTTTVVPGTTSPAVTVPVPDGGMVPGGEPSEAVLFVGDLLGLPVLNWHTDAEGDYWDAAYAPLDQPEAGAATFTVAPGGEPNIDLLPGGTSVVVDGADQALYRESELPTLVMVAGDRLLVLTVPAAFGLDQAAMIELGVAIVGDLPAL